MQSVADEEGEEAVQEEERRRWHCVRCGSLLPTGWDEELIGWNFVLAKVVYDLGRIEK